MLSLSAPSLKRLSRLRRQSGFTLVEMLVVAPIVLIVIGILVTAMVSMVGDALASNARTVIAYNTRDALNRIEEDARISINFMSSFSLLSAPQGEDGATAPFTSASGDLIMTQQATTSNPYSTSRSLVYYANQPNACTGDKSGNRALLNRVIYFTKTGSDGNKELWRRVIVRDNNQNGTVDANTTCDAPWQRNSCAKADVGSGQCKAVDELLLEHITNFTPTYYTASGTTTTAPTLATSIGISLSTSEKVAGKQITQTGKVQVARTNDVPSLPPPTTPIISLFNDGVSSYNNPIKASFQWSASNAQAYSVSTRVNGSAWSTPEITTATTKSVDTGPNQTVSIRVIAYNDTTNSATAQFDTQTDLFTDLNLENGWVPYGSTYAPPSFTITSAGYVKVRGLIKDGSGKITTLPDGFRPSQRIMITVMATPNIAAWLTVSPDGTVSMTNGTTYGWLSLDNVSFLAKEKTTWSAVPSGSFTCPTGCTTRWRDYTASGGGGGYINTGFAKDAMGRIYLEGLVNAPVPNSAPAYSNIFTIPNSSFYSTSTSGAVDIYPTSSNYAYSDYAVNNTYVSYRQGSGAFYSMHSIYYGTSPAPTWTNATLANSWVNYNAAGTGYSQASYTKASDGVVVVRGLIKSGTNTNGTVVFTLPVGSRPKYRLLYLTADVGPAPARIDIFPTGEVEVWNAPANGWMSLAGINFIAEQ